MEGPAQAFIGTGYQQIQFTGRHNYARQRTIRGNAHSSTDPVCRRHFPGNANVRDTHCMTCRLGTKTVIFVAAAHDFCSYQCEKCYIVNIR